MKLPAMALSLSLLLGAALAPGPLAQSTPQPTAITEQEAQAIGVDAYLYLYSLVTMDLTRKQLTNVEPGKGLGGPMNMFQNIPTFPPADMRAVVRPKFDTLYSSAWLDLTQEPVVVSVPDTGGRYYLLPMLDMWTDVFASPGWRTTGTQAGHFLMRTPPKIQVDTMLAGKFFAYAAELMRLHPPHITDEPILARMKRIGLEPGKSFDIAKLDPGVAKALEGVPPGADKDAKRLPAPKGAFNLTMRLYAPRCDALTGKWNPPPVVRLQVPSLSAQ
jgi:hypothetical protein